MSDLRQGVTETQHAVLDLIDARSGVWSECFNFEERLRLGVERAKSAQRCTALSSKRMYALEAAARLIDVADEIGRLLGPDGDA